MERGEDEVFGSLWSFGAKFYLNFLLPTETSPRLKFLLLLVFRYIKLFYPFPSLLSLR